MTRETSLFELPTTICYCVGNGSAACAPCRERRKLKAAEVARPLDVIPYIDMMQELAKTERSVKQHFLLDPKYLVDTQPHIKPVVTQGVRPAVPDDPRTLSNRERIRRICRHLDIDLQEYASAMRKVAQDSRNYLHTSDFPGVMAYAGLVGSVIVYWDIDARLLLPAWDTESCPGATCGNFGGSPCGRSYDPCTYCSSDLYHKDTFPQ